MSFDGVGDYIQADIGTTSGDITYTFWFNSPNTGATKRIITRDWSGGGSFTTHHAGDALYGVFRDSGGSQGTILNVGSLSDSNWYFAAFLYNGTDVKSYLNGVPGQEAVQASILTDSEDLYIGALAFDFLGTINGARVYNGALSATEIELLYNRGRN